MRKWKTCFRVVFMCVLAGVCCLLGYSRVEAKSNLKMYSSENNTISKTASVQMEQYSTSKNSGSSGNRWTYKMYLTAGGKKTLIHDDVSYSFLSDGSTIYYIAKGAYIKSTDIDDLHKTTVYKYTVSTGKRKKVVSSTGLEFRDCAKSKYAYLTYQKKNFIWDQYGFCVLDLKTGKIKKMGNNNQSDCEIYKDRVVVYPSGGAIFYSGRIYSYKLNGTGAKRIATGAFWGIKKGKIYYIQENQKTRLVRGYRCSMTGKGKKAVTKWVSESKFPWSKVR